jgi:hypothetical protein
VPEPPAPANRPTRLAASQAKYRDRKGKALKELIEQSALLPVRTVARPQADENVIGGELSQGILECQQWIIGSHRPPSLAAEILQLAKHRLKPLIGLLSRFVSCRGEPLEAGWQGRSHDQNLLGSPKQLLNSEWQFPSASCRFTGDD